MGRRTIAMSESAHFEEWKGLNDSTVVTNLVMGHGRLAMRNIMVMHKFEVTKT